MSYVTSIVLSLGSHDCCGSVDKLSKINEYFGETHGLIRLKSHSLEWDSYFGGDKGFEAFLFIGAFNYLSIDAFLAHLRLIKWNNPEGVQLFVKPQDELFQLIDVMKG